MSVERDNLPLSSASSLYPLDETHFPIGVYARNSRRRGNNTVNLTSHGPPPGMPIFGPDRGEIMNVTDMGGDTVTIYTEDLIDPEKLIPTVIHRKDYYDLLRLQTRR